MSINRLNHLLMAQVIPFNYGMNYQDCLKFYDAYHGTLGQLCPIDPRTWTQDTVDKVNKRAEEQTELVDRLMILPDDEFYAEVDKLRETENDD